MGKQRTLHVFSEEKLTKQHKRVVEVALDNEQLKKVKLCWEEDWHDLKQGEKILSEPMLVLGKPSPELIESGVKMINGPSIAMVMGTPKGLEMLSRSIRLWDKTTRGKLTDPTYKYVVIEPGHFGLAGLVQSTLGHTDLIVDIEISGDIKIDEPEDTELISVAVLFVRPDDTYRIYVWSKEALADAECRDALIAMLTCGVPLTAHNGQFDFKWLNNHFKEGLRTTSKARKRWGDMYAKTPGRLYPDADTFLTHYALFPGLTGEHGLKHLVQTLCGAPEYEAELKKYTVGGGHYENIPRDLLHEYNAGDVFWTWHLKTLLDEWLAESPPAQKLLREVLMPATRMFIDVEDSEAGITLDLQYSRILEAKLASQAEEQLQDLRVKVGDPSLYLSEASRVQREKRINDAAAWNAAAASEDATGTRWRTDRVKVSETEILSKKGKPKGWDIEYGEKKVKLRKPLPLTEAHQFNPGSWMQVKSWLFAHGHKVESTNEKTLKELQLSPDIKGKTRRFIDALLEYRHTTKMLGTYVSGVIANERNGRVRPKHKLTGTVTGRLAATKPAVQTIPRGETFRRMYQASEGMVLLGADYAQMETRCVAELCGDKQMIDDLQIGRPDFFDILVPPAFPSVFRDFAEAMEFKAKDKALYNELYRGRIKPFSHGVNYGRGARAIGLDLKMPLWQAEQIMDSYLDRYPKLRQWQAATMGFVRGEKSDDTWELPGLWTPFGRRFQQGVIYDKNEFNVKNSALAFRPQSIGSDICLTAAIDLHANYMPKYGARLVMFIHDALYAECPIENADELLKVMEERMMASARAVFSRVPFPVEAKQGHYWSEV